MTAYFRSNGTNPILNDTLSPAYILATMPVYEPTELSRANRVATVQRSLRSPRTLSRPDPYLATLSRQIMYIPWCHLVFRHASVTAAVVIS